MLVRLTIYDISGREIQTLINKKLQSGSYEVEWDGSNFSSGIYFYKLDIQPSDRSERSDDYQQTKKMILLK